LLPIGAGFYKGLNYSDGGAGMTSAAASGYGDPQATSSAVAHSNISPPRHGLSGASKKRI